MSVILEANQNNADFVYANGKYNCSFPTGITFNKGDRLTARLCSIDSQKSDTTTIVLKEDVTATIKYSYYDCDYDQPGAKRNLAGAANWGTTYDYFAAYSIRKFFTLNSSHVSLTIEDFGAETEGWDLTVRMDFTYIDVNGNVQNTQGTTSTYVFNNVGFFNDGTFELSCDAQVDIVYMDGTLQINQINVYLIDPNTGIVYIDHQNVDTNQYRPGLNVITAAGAPPAPNLRVGHNTVNIAAGKYDPSEIADLLTKGLTDPGGIQPVPATINQVLIPNNSLLINLAQLDEDQGLPNDMIFSRISNNVPDLSPTGFGYTWAPQVPYYFIGASIMAFQYGLTGSIFQWSYGHMPFYNAAPAGSRNAVIYVSTSTGYTRYYLLTTASGVVIHDLQPVDFWTQLGLYNTEKQPIITPLLTDPVSGLEYYTKDSWQSPREGTTIGFFTPLFVRSPTLPVVGTPTYFDTTAVDTAALLGNEITSNVDGGYFLVRAAFNGSTSEYYDNSNIYDNIVSIVSTQYNTANTITGFADSAVVYEHTGAPYIISSVSIDILDPRTKETASGLGSNNTIIFEIDRAPQNINILDVKGKPQIIQVLS